MIAWFPAPAFEQARSEARRRQVIAPNGPHRRDELNRGGRTVPLKPFPRRVQLDEAIALLIGGNLRQEAGAFTQRRMDGEA